MVIIDEYVNENTDDDSEDENEKKLDPLIPYFNAALEQMILYENAAKLLKLE